MDAVEARAQLESWLDWSSDPALTAFEVDSLMARAGRVDRWGNDPRNSDATAPVWQASTAYAAGDVVTPTSGTGRFLRCTRPGTSGGTEPSWPDTTITIGLLVTDGDEVQWETCGTTWEPTWNLEAAVAQGWRMKAAKAAGRFQFATDGQSFNRQQVAANCMEMAAMYERRNPGSTRTSV